MRPSTAIALLALFFSLAGNAVAFGALITSRDIKDGTIQLRDIAPSTRALLRAAQGPVGPEGPVGPTGPVGPAGTSASTYLLESRLISVESKLSAAERRISGVCLYGKVVRDIRQSLFSNNWTVDYVYC